MEQLIYQDKTLFVSGELSFQTVPDLYEQTEHLLKDEQPQRINISAVSRLDSAGVAFLETVLAKVKATGSAAVLEGASEEQRKVLRTFSSQNIPPEAVPVKAGYFEQVADSFLKGCNGFFNCLVMASDIFYWALKGLFSRAGQKKGATVQQAYILGEQALPVVGLLSLILGFILSLQSANQLKNFGANVFLADGLAFAFVRELGPMITAIIVAGRSGSAIASEIASMKVSEEIDALRMMAINPIRYVVVPKFHAMSYVLPVLVMFSIIIGMLSGMLIAITYLDVSLQNFCTRAINILSMKDFVISFSKTVFFAWLIVSISSYYGFSVEGGAEDVGRATTQSVVSSIIAIIFFDAVFSLIYL